MNPWHHIYGIICNMKAFIDLVSYMIVIMILLETCHQWMWLQSMPAQSERITHHNVLQHVANISGLKDLIQRVHLHPDFNADDEVAHESWPRQAQTPDEGSWRWWHWSHCHVGGGGGLQDNTFVKQKVLNVLVELIYDERMAWWIGEFWTCLALCCQQSRAHLDRSGSTLAGHRWNGLLRSPLNVTASSGPEALQTKKNLVCPGGGRRTCAYARQVYNCICLCFAIAQFND